MLQCFIQFGSDEQRREVFDELKGWSSHQCMEMNLCEVILSSSFLPGCFLSRAHCGVEQIKICQKHCEKVSNVWVSHVSFSVNYNAVILKNMDSITVSPESVYSV